VREYKRFLFFFPQSAKSRRSAAEDARFISAAEWDEALAVCDNLISKDPAHR